MAPRLAVLTVVETGEIIRFDALVTATHNNTAEVTQHPVEEGSDIADHIRSQPDELTVSVIVTNTPPILLSSIRATPITGFSDPASRAEDSHEFLRGVMRKKLVVNFSSTLRDYVNMAITSMSVDRDAATGNMVQLNLTLKEIIIATTETVQPPVPIKQGRKQKTDQGKKTKSPTSAPVEEKSRSVGTQIAGAIGSLFGG